MEPDPANPSSFQWCLSAIIILMKSNCWCKERKEGEAQIPYPMLVMVIFTKDKKADLDVPYHKNKPFCPYLQFWQLSMENADLKNS